MKNKRMLAVCLVLVLMLGAIGITSMADGSKEVDQASLFELSGAMAELKDESLDFKMTEKTATIKFKQPLGAAGFSFRWNGVEDEQKLLESMAVQLTDSKDPNCSIKLTYGKLSDQYISVTYNNDARTYLASGATYKANLADLAFTYNENTNYFVDDNGAFMIEAGSCQNGDGFNGFESLAVDMEIQLTGKPGATFSLRAINGQTFGSEYTLDTVEPRLCIAPTAAKKAAYGSELTIVPAAAYDVFQEKTTLKLTVKAPSGETVKAVDGTKLSKVDGTKEYTFEASEYGQYRVTYVASDGINDSRGMGYRINVADSGDPVVTLKEDMDRILTVGKKFTFPEINIEDNVEGEFTTWVNVMHPAGYMSCEQDSFTPEEEGHYTITFNAQDANGNIGRLRIKVYAEQEDK